jgi:cation diffusion facilitator CzcD-associated flavoprotein CzcO
VDSPFPFYQFYEGELLQGWRWKNQFPTRAEMLQYFEYVDKQWDISTSFEFGTSVSGAEYSEVSHRWSVSLEDGRQTTAQWLIPAVGFTSSINMPQINGFHQFRGPIYHTAKWPRDGGMDMRDKKVAVIGTGPSGVQIIQSIGKVAKSMTIYQQSPSLTLRKYSSRTSGSDTATKTLTPQMGLTEHQNALQLGLESFNGFHYALRDHDALTIPTEERKIFYQNLYLEGGWAFWMAGFRDIGHSLQANKDAYTFWAEQTRPRISDLAKRKLLVPEVSAIPFGVRRPCLEEDLYEVLNQSNVEIIDISKEKIEALTETGIRAQGHTIEFDAIILATGFSDDASGLRNLNIRGRNGVSLTDAWSKGVQSHLGMTVNQFPNMFFLYGPQCPTLLVNSPAVITVQVEWLERVISHCRQHNVSRLEATDNSHNVWQQKIEKLWVKSLYSNSSRKNEKKGSKVKERTWIGGLQMYRSELESCLANGLEGFE